MNSHPIPTAVIGFGLAGRVFHAPFIIAVPGLHLAAIVQRHGDEAAQTYPQTRILRSIDEALADPTIQLLIIATPNDTHFSLAKQALQAGKHVVIDKPFAATSAEARELVDLAAARNLILAPFHNRRWDGDFLTLRKLLDAHTLGRVTTFESHFDRFRPLPRAGTWKESSSPANGLLMDLGPHLVDQAMALFGLPKAITASVRHDRDATEIEDAFDITLHYAGPEGHGLLAHCRSTMIAADPAPRFRIHGTLGSFRKHGLDPQEPALVAGAKVPPVGSSEAWLPEHPSAWGTLTLAPDPAQPNTLTHTQIETAPGDYRLFYANVRDAILGTAPLAVPAEQGFRVIRLLELARQSSAERRTLPIDFA